MNKFEVFKPEKAEFSPEEKAEAIPELEKDLTSGSWLRVDEGLAIERDSNFPDQQKEKFRKPIISTNGPYYPETYSVNNHVIGVITKNGKYLVTPYTEERMQLVQKAYKEGSVPVIFSNGEVPADESTQQKWEDLRTLAQAEETKKKIKGEQQL